MALAAIFSVMRNSREVLLDLLDPNSAEFDNLRTGLTTNSTGPYWDVSEVGVNRVAAGMSVTVSIALKRFLSAGRRSKIEEGTT
jgi:hypothetical protein